MLAPLLAVLAAAPAADAPAFAAWVQPLGTLAAGADSLALGRSRALYLPIGFSVAPPPLPFELAFELTFAAGEERIPNASRTVFGGLASAGPVFRLFSPRRLSGFFVAPKIWASYLQHEAIAPLGFEIFQSGTTAELGAGLDLGYQLSVGRLYGAVVVGAGAGVAFGGGAPLGSIYAFDALFSGWSDPQGANQPALFLSLNLNLVRLGVAF